MWWSPFLNNNMNLFKLRTNSICVIDGFYAFLYIVAIVRFSRSTYSVHENGGSMNLLLHISKPSSFPYTVEVASTDGLAGKLL